MVISTTHPKYAQYLHLLFNAMLFVIQKCTNIIATIVKFKPLQNLIIKILTALVLMFSFLLKNLNKIDDVFERKNSSKLMRF
jgi:hypothetical protein